MGDSTMQTLTDRRSECLSVAVSLLVGKTTDMVTRGKRAKLGTSKEERPKKKPHSKRENRHTSRLAH